MTWFELLFSVIITTLIAGLLLAMPSIVHQTVPLGVNVPQDRVNEPVIRRAVLGYRVAIVVAWVLAIGGAIVFAGQPVIVVTVPILLVLILGAAAYLVARSSIRRAKTAGKWYEGVRVRRRAEVTAQGSPRPPIWWAIVSICLLLAVVAIGVVLYPSLPNRMPVHWNAAGVVNRYAAKSVFSVFGPVLIGIGVVVLVFACSYLGRLSAGRPVVSDTVEEAAHRADAQRRLLTSLLGQLGLLVALVISALTLTGWFAPHSNVLFIALPVGLVLLIAAILVVFLVRYSRAMGRARARRAATGQLPDSPDDDRYWKGGIVYVNHDDSAVFVPKRFGVGWTINAGSPGGIAVLFVLLVVIVGAIVSGILFPNSH